VTSTTYRDTYDRIARDHVAHWRATGHNPFQSAREIKENEKETLRLLHTTTGSILDVGCGMGDLLLHFPHRECMGVDISEDYLTVARERGLEVVQAEAESLPFDDDSFDVVVGTDILEHVFDMNQVAAEMVRVARVFVLVRVPNMAGVEEAEPYGFVHARILDEGTLRVLFGPILGCGIAACHVRGSEIHLLAKVPCLV
jgi:ubiquinone/menaquinone biosynthesis C-methylase UbiE